MKFYLSIAILVSGLLGTVIVQMELRRQGYELLKLQRELQKELAQYRGLKAKLAAELRPDHVREYGRTMSSLSSVSQDQVIYITGREVDREKAKREKVH